MHVDELIPRPDIDKRHSVLVSAPPDRSWHAIERLDLRDSLTIRWLFRLRGLPTTSVTWDSLMRLGFTEIVADPPRETVLGLVAQPWRPKGGIRRVPPEDFSDFNQPGYVKIVWNFAVTPASTGSRVTTVTLVTATNDAARRRFRRYWRLVGPASGVVRRRALALIARSATSGPE